VQELTPSSMAEWQSNEGHHRHGARLDRIKVGRDMRSHSQEAHQRLGGTSDKRATSSFVPTITDGEIDEDRVGATRIIARTLDG